MVKLFETGKCEEDTMCRIIRANEGFYVEIEDGHTRGPYTTFEDANKSLEDHLKSMKLNKEALQNMAPKQILPSITRGEVIEKAIAKIELCMSQKDDEAFRILCELKELKERDTCYMKSRMDEWIFILRGQDKLAPRLIRKWAERARKHGAPQVKVVEAIALARSMEIKGEKTSKYPD